ncbi:hypothetical protein Tco_0890757 [Tanacetum coccineum]|uniref:Uncharacterized protein n=1 Tax=Tanacetum coccineum TaxID=301880 RepID=A0ABQ5C101_9ASTR
MRTKTELTLEQTQQGVSDEVLVSIEGVEELKRKFKINGEKKEALLALRQKPVMRTTSAAVKPCQGDSLEFYLITVENPTSIIFDQTIANLKAQLVKNEMVRVMIPKCMSLLDACDEPIGDMEDKVDNSKGPKATPQVLLSFEVYTLAVTYPKEVDETIEILMEVEPLDHTKLDDLGFDNCNHDISFSSKEIPSVDEPKP